LLPLAEALRFLTVLPLPAGSTPSEQTTARALLWFPVAGLVIGLLLVGVGGLAGALWGTAVQAACLVVAWVIITSGLHLDGLSDTFDAVASWRNRERKLEIMKDSHVGVMGVLAIVAVLLLKFAWLHDAGSGGWRGILLAPVWGRWTAVYGMLWFPSARAGGLGQRFKAHLQRRDILWPAATALLLSVGIAGWRGIVAACLVWGSAALIYRWWTHDLGGLTGDTYGAMIEIAEVVTLAALIG
jgi:adenosylcobinamide-GDP ribazoletransferase